MIWKRSCQCETPATGAMSKSCPGEVRAKSGRIPRDALASLLRRRLFAGSARERDGRVLLSQERHGKGIAAASAAVVLLRRPADRRVPDRPGQGGAAAARAAQPCA